MSNTAVLFQALQHQQQQQLSSPSSSSTSPSSAAFYNMPKSYTANPSLSPSHRNAVSPNSAKNMKNDTSIRRGAEIVRQQLSFTQSSGSPMNGGSHNSRKSTSFIKLPSSLYRMEPNGRNFNQRRYSKTAVPNQPVDEFDDDEDDGNELTTEDLNTSTEDHPIAKTTADGDNVVSSKVVDDEDHLSVTSWSQYDLNSYHGHRLYTNNTIEMNPPSVADWSIDDQIHDDETTTSIPAAIEDYEHEEYKFILDDIPICMKQQGQFDDSLVGEDENEDEDEEQYRQSRNNILLQHHHETAAAVVNNHNGFISSDGDDSDDDDKVDAENDDSSNNTDANNDSDDDIVSVLPVAVESALRNVVPSPAPPGLVASETQFFQRHKSGVDTSFEVPPNTIPATSSGSSSDSADYYRHRTIAISPKSKKKNWSSYPIPYQFDLSAPTTTEPKTAINVKGDLNNTSNFFLGYDVDAYCGSNKALHVDSDAESPDKPPIQEIPAQTTPNTTISNLTTTPRDGNSSRHRQYSKQQTSIIMKQYDVLLADPAYVHALNAGYIWQSIVGQHIRFPKTWWDGARGPPITNNTNANNAADTDSDISIPWMYFGRHTIKNHEILNQLVKCRASAGRLLLHIVVQDLMTRTPIQDIVIGVFHPNSKNIRPRNSPALKKLEDCRDIYMAVRKRSLSSVAATDTLLYSPSNWENTSTNGSAYAKSKSTYQYSISRSPLGSGQRVDNQNVRAVFGDKAPLETIFLSEDELYERLMNKITMSQKQRQSTTTNVSEMSPPLAILQDLVFA